MTIKQAVDIAIASEMTTFAIYHHEYSGKIIEQTVDTVYDFIKGYENDIVMTIYFGSAHHEWHKYHTTYTKQECCTIIFKGENEILN